MRAILSSASLWLRELPSRKCAGSASGFPASCSTSPPSKASRNRSDAPRAAKTPGARIAAKCTSNSNLSPARPRRRFKDQIRATLAQFPGVQTEVLTFLGDRIGETMSGETAQVVVNIFGDDLDVLDEKANEVSALLNKIPGAADVQISAPPGAPRTGRAIASRPAHAIRFPPDSKCSPPCRPPFRAKPSPKRTKATKSLMWR